MPIFYIDIYDGKQFMHDDFGMDFPTAEAARDQAMRTLLDFARGGTPGQDGAYVATIRDTNGQPVYQTKLSFSSTEIN